MTVQKKRNLAHHAIIVALLLVLVSVLPVTYRAVAHGQQKAPASASMIMFRDAGPAAMPAMAQPIKVKQAPASQPASAPAKIKGSEDADGLLRLLLTAVQGGNWQLVAWLAFALVVLGLRRFSSKLIGWLPSSWASGRFSRLLAWCNTDRGGAILAIISGAIIVFIDTVAAGKGITPQILPDAIKSAIGSAGIYVLAKKIAKPSDKVPAVEPAATPPG